MTMTHQEIVDYNRRAWDGLVRNANRWTIPVTAAEIEAARNGAWNVVLTPVRSIPISWFPVPGASMLCLASGGGQQVPVLAAAGFDVTSFDLTPAQLETDQRVADTYQLKIRTVEGDMTNLAVFDDNSFDCVFNPCSTAFIPDVTKVYREVARVLKPGGVFMTGFTNPVYYLFDLIKAEEKGEFHLRYSMPYSDESSLDEQELKWLRDKGEPLVYGHSLTDLLAGQISAGLEITHFFEDGWGGENAVDNYFKPFIATRAVKKQY